MQGIITVPVVLWLFLVQPISLRTMHDDDEAGCFLLVVQGVLVLLFCSLELCMHCSALVYADYRSRTWSH